MGKKILDSKALYVVFSILIAVSLWFYVASLEGNEDTKSFNNIPVQFEGMETLESKGLMIVSETPSVSVKVQAPFNILAQLDKEMIKVTVDVSRIDEASQYTMGYTVSYPSSLSGSIQTVSQAPTNVTFTVARYTSQEIPLRGVFEGSVADGYLPGGRDDFLFTPSTITVSGQADLVNQIAYAQVVVTGEELTETVSGEYPYQLMSNSGEPLDLDVECSAETVYVTFPVWATAEIPLTVNFTDGGGITEKNVRYDIDHKSITISGDKDDVAAISAIELEPIDLATVRDGDVITRKIPLANELNNLSGYTEVSITIHISGVVTKSVNVESDNISCINVPDGWEPALITQAITVEIRGPRDELETISGESVLVVADLSEVNEAAGQYTLTARVYLNSVGTEAGVVGTDYRVVVSLAPQAP